MFRFTIRDVLWLTVVVALAVGWGLPYWQLSENRDLWKNRAEFLQYCMTSDFHVTVSWDDSGVIEMGETPATLNRP